MRSVSSKNRKPVEEHCESTVVLPEWIKNGVEAVRFVPSAKNSQKVMFHYDGENLTVTVIDDYAMDLVDCRRGYGKITVLKNLTN